MKRVMDKNRRRAKRKLRIRGQVTGTAACPRLSVYRSNRNLYVQAIDDSSGTTIAAASTVAADLKGLAPKTENAAKVGETIGKALKKKKIETAVFDRNGYLYHGVVEALAEGARKAGVKF